MTPDEMQQLLSERNNAVVAINRKHGGPHVTPVWYLWDGATFYFSTTTDRAKFKNIRRDPSISLIVHDGPSYVAAYGRAEVMESDFADLARQVVAKYAPAEQVEQWAAMAQAPGRIIVKLKPEKLVTSADRVGPTE
jgi:PPOX class probable F420-dependent enzyme